MSGEIYTVKFVDNGNKSQKDKLNWDCTLYKFYIDIKDQVTCVSVKLPSPIFEMNGYDTSSDECSKTNFILEITNTIQDNARRDITPAMDELTGLFEQFEDLGFPSEFSYEFLEKHRYGYSLDTIEQYFKKTISTLDACDLGCDDPLLNLLNDSKNIEIITLDDLKNTSYLVAPTLKDLVKATSEFFEIWSLDDDNFKQLDK